MNSRNKSLAAEDIKEVVINLQNLGDELKKIIYKLPDSVIKNYMLFETSKILELKTAYDFYYLQNKISRMLKLTIRWELGNELLKILEEMVVGIERIVQHIEVEEELRLSWHQDKKFSRGDK